MKWAVDLKLLATAICKTDIVVYLAQEDNPALVDKARTSARKIGLNFHYRKVGYGDLEIALKSATGAHNVSG